MNKAYIAPYTYLGPVPLCPYARNIGFGYCQDFVFSLLSSLLYVHVASNFIYTQVRPTTSDPCRAIPWLPLRAQSRCGTLDFHTLDLLVSGKQARAEF